MKASNERRVRLPKTIVSERRDSHRFPLALDVRYTLAGQQTMEMGYGHTVDISSCGLSFIPDRPVSVGQNIEAVIDWPARLHGTVRLQLILSGVVVRSDGTGTALRIQRYEFKTRRVAQEPL